MSRFFIGIMLAFGLLIVLIVLIVNSGGTSTPKSSGPPLWTYATAGSSVSLTIDGPINSETEHNKIQMVVTSSSATINIEQGYDGRVINSSTYPNSLNAYNSFLHALQYAGFTLGSTASSLSDESGYCAIGDRYVLELQNYNQVVSRFWTTSCGGVHSFEGNIAENLSLFEAQVPDSTDHNPEPEHLIILRP